MARQLQLCLRRALATPSVHVSSGRLPPSRRASATALPGHAARQWRGEPGKSRGGDMRCTVGLILKHGLCFGPVLSANPMHLRPPF